MDDVLREYFKGDNLAAALGMKIEQAEAGTAGFYTIGGTLILLRWVAIAGQLAAVGAALAAFWPSRQT